MFRKLFLFAAFLLSLTAATAQTTGEWKIFTLFTGDITKIVDTPDYVYYTSGNRLFSYDKKSNETYVYTTQNKLNDVNVSLIQYNPAGKYLFVGYDNSNIDLIYDNGRVVNLCDIKDATLTYDKNINSVTFDNNRIYVATKFGFITFDDKKHEVVESGIFGIPVETVFPMGDFLVLHRFENNSKKLFASPINAHHNTFNKFTEVGSIDASWIVPVSDHAFIFADGTSKMQGYGTMRKNADGSAIELTETVLVGHSLNEKATVSPNGVYFTSATMLVYVDEDGQKLRSYVYPQALTTQKVSTAVGPESLWAADADGIANYRLNDDGSLTVLSDKAKPEGIGTQQVFQSMFDNTGALWINNLGSTQYRAGLKGDYLWYVQQTTRLRNDIPEDVNLWVASADVSDVRNQQRNNNSTRMYGGVTGFDVDPENPNRYFQANALEGIYVIEDNKELFKFTTKHIPVIPNGWLGAKEVKFDPQGNLWVGFWTKGTTSPYYVLPKSVLRSKKFEDITTSDWRPSAHYGTDNGNKDMRILFCKKSDVFFTVKADKGFGFTFTNGKLDDPTQHKYYEVETAVDQDGKEWSTIYSTSLIEDQRGRVWIGTNSGLIEITDPAKFTTSSPVKRLKVPRNDGTNYADYLCESDFIYDMAVDNSNRKWIATESSGVYLVSEDGDRIIEHFTTDNSPLPENMVLSVACDPNSNKVYFGMRSGLLSYNSDSAPAAEDFSEVYAYPNPVRPDYTGPITITGLMKDSLIKIVDVQGNVVYQTRSESGMATWDGFDNSHNPAKSGVYFVMASEGANGGSESVVTKIMIVR